MIYACPKESISDWLISVNPQSYRVPLVTHLPSVIRDIIQTYLQYPPLKIVIADWKRSKEIHMNSFGKYGKRACTSIADCNYLHYNIQLNLYADILRRYYHVQPVHLENVVFHPNNQTYQTFPQEIHGSI